jgi:predicted transcriptional regulator
MDSKLFELTADVVASYVSKNAVSAGDLPSVIEKVFGALSSAGRSEALAAEEAQKPSAAHVRKSIQPDHLVSFVDGRKYKTLKRHLTTHGLTFAQYREKFGLPQDYPTVAPAYSARRSALAKQLGLGQGGRGGMKARAAAKPAGKGAKVKKATEEAT